MISDDFDIDKIVNEIDFEGNMHTHIKNNIFLTQNQISVLEMYQIDYKNCVDMAELLCKIEYVLDDVEDEQLEETSRELAEFNYYNNTNK